MTPQNAEILKTFTQDDFDRFAALSGDYNPIHVDPVFAANTRFGRTVAHGALLVTILRGLTEQIAPNGRQVSHKVKFPAPTFAGEAIKFSAAITTNQNGITYITLIARRQIDGAITCVGEAIVSNKEERP